jgi:quaternary ammonium compound-resistance protein SugE
MMRGMSSTASWIILVIAGLLEIGWSVGLKYADGFTKLVPSILTAIGLIASVALLATAARTLPIGTAYGVWVGIGSFGAAVLGIVLFNEPATAGRIFFLALLVISVVGLKATTP